MADINSLWPNCRRPLQLGTELLRLVLLGKPATKSPCSQSRLQMTARKIIANTIFGKTKDWILAALRGLIKGMAEPIPHEDMDLIGRISDLTELRCQY